jgi:hypothetical protein
VPSKKRDTAYFSDLQRRLAAFSGVEHLSANPLTGTVLATGASLDVDAFTAAAGDRGLFVLQTAERTAVSPHHALLAPVEDLDNSLRRLSGGEIDLAVATFMALVGFGLWELARGNFKTPPWYTAFWYAFGVLTKSLVDRDRSG